MFAAHKHRCTFLLALISRPVRSIEKSSGKLQHSFKRFNGAEKNYKKKLTIRSSNVASSAAECFFNIITFLYIFLPDNVHTYVVHKIFFQCKILFFLQYSFCTNMLCIVSRIKFPYFKYNFKEVAFNIAVIANQHAISLMSLALCSLDSCHVYCRS